ncbi:MAG: ATP-binding cassette domain-containing protein, partial [Pseudomonadota bacterium]
FSNLENLVGGTAVDQFTLSTGTLSGTIDGGGGGDTLETNVATAVTFELTLPSRVAVIGPAGSGKEQLALILSNLLAPDSGRVLINDIDLTSLPETITGRHMAYVGSPANVMSGTIEDNLFYGLKHRPLETRDGGESEEERRKRLRENERSGNSPLDIESEWTDYSLVALDDPGTRLEMVNRVLRTVLLDQDIYGLGLRSQIDLSADKGLAAKLLEARRELFKRISDDERLSRLVEVFDPDTYNTNATLGENLLFGTPVDDTLDMDKLAEQPYVLEVIKKTGLEAELREVGYNLASTMVELFADLPPDHEYFRQFSFIKADDLPDYRNLLNRVEKDRLDKVSAEDGRRLLALPFKLIPARHRLGLVEDDLRNRLLEARKYFRDNLPDDLKNSIAFFDPEEYTEALSVQDNILFGKIAYGQAQAPQRVGQLLAEILEKLELRERVVAQGLAHECGSAGSRLSAAQRQKLALAREIIKQPKVLILYDPTGPLDSSEQNKIRQNILDEFKDRTIFWVLNDPRWSEAFDQVVVLERGRVVECGSPDELSSKGGKFNDLTKAA